MTDYSSELGNIILGDRQRIMEKLRETIPWRRISGGILLIVMMVTPIAVSFHFNGIRLSPEAMDNAQLARNIARGRGFVTGVIRPASRLFAGSGPRHPDLYQPPLPALGLSAAFRIFGASDPVVAIWSLVLFWVTGLLAFSLVRRVWSAGAAFLCAALYFTNALSLNAVQQGDPSLLGSLIFIGLLSFLSRTRITPVSGLAGGLFCALGYLSTSSPFWIGTWLLVGGFYCFRAKPGARLDHKGIFALVAGFILPLLFCWGRNILVGGYLFSPLRAAEYKMFTSIFPGDSLLRETGREIFSQVPGGKALLGKWWQGGELLYDRLLYFTGSFAVVFFWPALLLPFSNRKFSRIRYLVFGCLLLAAGQFVVFARRIEDIRLLIPAAMPLAAVAFLFLLEKIGPAGKLSGRLALGLLIGLNLLPAIDRLQISHSPPDPVRHNCLRISGLVPRGAGIITDQPEAVAWYADRSAWWLPAEIEEGVEGFDYLYLTPAVVGYPPLREGGRVVIWPRVFQARGRSPFWEAEDFSPLPGGHFLCRMVPVP